MLCAWYHVYIESAMIQSYKHMMYQASVNMYGNLFHLVHMKVVARKVGKALYYRDDDQDTNFICLLL